MIFIKALRLALINVPLALRLALLPILVAIAGEGLQHGVEYYLGMYESREQFIALQASPLRISFGVIKVLAVFFGAYFTLKFMIGAKGPKSAYVGLAKTLLRKSWDMRATSLKEFALTLFVSLALLVPMIFVHYRLNHAAMDSAHDLILLSADSVLIGLMALAMGLAQWAAMLLCDEDNRGA
jgi:uncharacterized membrane protein YhaH (DUF805 family)